MESHTKIPTIIHYCWFGKGEKPDIVKQCIGSFKNIMPNYEVIEWNESNFDINSNIYVKEAYDLKKYAFVSDYVRVKALYEFGGIYFDTDVEVLKSMDDFLMEDSFWGFEEKNYIATSTIGAAPRNILIKQFLDSYEGKKFILEDGKTDTGTNVKLVTEIFVKLGVEMNGKLQTIDGIGTVYPQEYFSPYDYINCRTKEAENSYCIHYFYKSWLPYKEKVKVRIKKMLVSIVGVSNLERLRRIKDLAIGVK